MSKPVEPIKPKHAGGRPVKTVANCLPDNWKDLILGMSYQGYSEAEIRAELTMNGKKFNHNLWYSLQDRDKEFQETITIGKVLCEAWWTSQARKGLRSKSFQSFIWFCNMKNRFGWKDKTDVEHSGSVTWEGLVNDFTRAKEKDLSRLQGISSN